MAAVGALGLDHHDIVQLARNSIVASFLDDDDKSRHLSEIDRARGSLIRSAPCRPNRTCRPPPPRPVTALVDKGKSAVRSTLRPLTLK